MADNDISNPGHNGSEDREDERMTESTREEDRIAVEPPTELAQEPLVRDSSHFNAAYWGVQLTSKTWLRRAVESHTPFDAVTTDPIMALWSQNKDTTEKLAERFGGSLVEMQIKIAVAKN